MRSPRSHVRGLFELLSLVVLRFFAHTLLFTLLTMASCSGKRNPRKRTFAEEGKWFVLFVALCAVSFLGKEAASLPRYLAWCHSLQSDFYSERREKETVKSLFVIFDVFLPFLSLLLGLLAGNR